MSNATDNPKIEVLKAGGSGVFTNYIYKAIPLAFDESMSYYETLVGLRNYLEETVIPTVNNNAEAVAELQSLYEELNKYVDDYFKNLDVQEEINNKLDNMTLDGTLTNLIKAYLDPYIDEQNEDIQDFEDSVRAEINGFDSRLSAVAQGSPAGVYPDLATLRTQNPDHSKIYITVDNGNWNYYNLSEQQFVSGGPYQVSQITNNSITKQKLNNNIFIDDGFNFKNINLNSTSRNTFGKGFVVEGHREITFKVKGIIKNDFPFSGNIIKIITRSMTTINDLGTSRSTETFNLISNDETSIDYTVTYDFTNYAYARIDFVTSTGSFDVNNNNLSFIGDIYVNDELIDVKNTLSSSADVAQYTFDYLFSGIKTVASVEEIKDLVNPKKINSITVASAQQLKNAIDSIATTRANNKANVNNIYNIYLESGTYELYPLIDTSNLQDQKLFKRGLEIPDYVNLIGKGNVIISCTVPDSDNTSSLNITRIVSTLNTYGENYFKNLTIVANNCRYCVHDDDGGPEKDRTIKFENCKFIHNGITTSSRWPYPCAYGSGYTGGRIGIFKNCIMQSTYRPFYVHTSSEYYMTDKFTLNIENCVFNTNDEYCVDIQDAYDTNNTGIIAINNSILSTKMLIRGTNKFVVFGGGNNSFTINNQNDSDIYIVQ